MRSPACLSCVPISAITLPVESPFALPATIPSWPSSVRGFAEGSIDLGGLEVRQVTTFDKVWSTAQGGQDGLGASFFRPSQVPSGFAVLGHYAQPNNRPLFGHLVVAKDTSDAGALLAPPLDYTLIWSSQDGNGSFWLPMPSDGYKAVGVAVTGTPDKPSLDEIRCVRADFTDTCETEEWVWGSDKDGFSAATLRPAARGIEYRGVQTGTFQVQSNATPANTSTLACLKNNSSNYTSCMPDLTQVNAILSVYSPQVYLHPNEQYFPSSVEWFFNNGVLLYQKGNPTPTPMASDGSNLPQGGGNDGEYWLDLPVDSNEKERVKKGDLASVRVYVEVKPMLGATATDLAIWFFCPFNGPARAKVGPVTIPLGKIGQHVGDWEHLTLRVTNFTGELLKLYFSQHSAGVWVDAPRLEYYDRGDNRPVAYASLHGHAFYPKPGLALQGDSRLGIGIRNDSAKGSRMDTGGRLDVVSAEYLGVAEPAWVGFLREWGPKIDYDIGREIDRVARVLPRFLRERLKKVVDKLPDEVLGEEGPTGPKVKGGWRYDERD